MKRSGFKPSTTAPKQSGYLRSIRREADEVEKLRAKIRKCAVSACRKPFEQFKSFVTWCSPECGAEIALAKVARDKARSERADRVETNAKLIELKPMKWWRKKAKTSMHAYVRARDEGCECASCDTILVKLGRVGGDYDAGHFRPVGLAKHLEFDERNIWGQCKYCNDSLRGNFQEYERRLRLRKGDQFVDELKADYAPRHLKIADFQQIEAHYKAELKKLKARAA